MANKQAIRARAAFLTQLRLPHRHATACQILIAQQDSSYSLYHLIGYRLAMVFASGGGIPSSRPKI